MKTHKATKKRFFLTGTGKVSRNKMMMRNNSHKKNKRKLNRNIVKDDLLITNRAERSKIKRLLSPSL